jgi:hypothetical protein
MIPVMFVRWDIREIQESPFSPANFRDMQKPDRHFLKTIVPPLAGSTKLVPVAPDSRGATYSQGGQQYRQIMDWMAITIPTDSHAMGVMAG